MKNGFVKILPKGTNCTAELYYFEGLNVVVKRCGKNLLNNEFGKLVIRDYLNVKNLVESKGVRVPFTYDIFLDVKDRSNLYIVESYMGKSLKEILVGRRSNKYKKQIIRESVEFIKKFPQNVPLDTNPGNIAIDRKGNFSFIDFIPPNQWLYEETKWEKIMNRAFVTTTKGFNYKNKHSAYFTTKGRLKRFDLHIKKLLRVN